MTKKKFLILPREGYPHPSALTLPKQFQVLDIPTLEVSSTMVRERIAKGLPFDELVPNGVAAYIKAWGLYKNGDSQESNTRDSKKQIHISSNNESPGVANNSFFDPQLAIDRCVAFLRDVRDVEKCGKFVIGVSGGIDSAVSLTLAVNAVGKENVYPTLLPYEDLGKDSVLDAMKVIQWLEIPQKNIKVIDIASIVNSSIFLFGADSDIRKGNLMARIRMMALYDRAKTLGAIVLGTENRTENVLGYFTRGGDEVSDVEPIRWLLKTEIRKMAATLGIPEQIVKKAPSAGLWQGQSDEGEFGFTYEEADAIIQLLEDKHMTPEEVVHTGYEKAVVEKVVARITSNAYKHRVPYIINH